MIDQVELLSWIGQLVLYGGGSVAIAFGAFRFFSEKWLQSKFDKNLEAFRHENAKELQSLRAQIDGTLSVRLRVQEKEFDVLSECWDLMNIAFGAAQSHTALFKQYPDISRMPDDARREYLDSLDLFEFQKKEIADDSNPTDALVRELDRQKGNEASKAHAEFHNAVNKHEIFMSDQTAKDFKEVARLIRSAIINKNVSSESKDLKMSHEAWKELEEKCSPQVQRISAELRSYLRSSLGD